MESQQSRNPYGSPIRDAKLLPVQPPAQPIGRKRELAAILGAVKTGSPVLLSGPAGAGKTALGALIALAQIASNPGGILWFNIVEDDFRMLVARVGRAYGVDTYTTTDAGAVQVLLEKHKPLLVMDGLLDLEAVDAFVTRCIPDTPTILTHEQAVSGPWMLVELGPLAEGDKQTLFRHYSGLQDSLYAADVEGLCKFLDGYPMTIQLAARLVAADNLTPAELMTMLPSSTGRDSQQMIMAIVFNRLSSIVQGLLMILAAAFHESVTTELLSELSNIPPAQVIPLARQLVTRGLARETVVYGQFAYTLHETARRYGLARLQNYQRLGGLEARMLQAVLTYTARHAADHERLEAEIGNILGAAAYATEHSNQDALKQFIGAFENSGNGFVAARLFRPELDQMKKLMTLLPPEISSLEVTQPAAFRPIAPPTAPVSPSVETPAVPSSLPGVDDLEMPTVKSESLITQIVSPAFGDTGAIEDSQATPAIPALQMPPEPPVTSDDTALGEDTSKSIVPVPKEPAHLEETLAAAPTKAGAFLDKFASPPVIRIEEPPAEIPEPVPDIGDTETPTAPSLASLERQLSEAQGAGDLNRQGPLLQTLGKVYLDDGDYPHALTYYQAALYIYEQLNDKDGMAASLEALTMLAARTSDPGDDLKYAERGAEIAKQLGDMSRLGRFQMAIGDARLAMGNPLGAVQAYTESTQTLRGTEDWVAIGLSLSKLGNAYLENNNPGDATLIFEQALVIFHKEGHQNYESRTLDRLALAYRRRQQWDKAEENYNRALFLARERFDRPSEMIYLAALGNLSYIQDRREEATTFYRQALHLAYMLDDTDKQAEYSRELAEILLEDTRTLSQAVQLLRESSEHNPDDPETKRLLQRADKRLERINAAGIALQSSEDSNRHFAASAYIT